ncbi:MAG: SIS domain-containing protein [Candidatus Eremiobacteraeota bacterium]|nr:SIS domain-containing protein [Candidatus Eremiobacteraeota bacterium]
MSAAVLGANFEREIREQPDVWERLAASDKADTLASALEGDVVLVGSGSSLFVGELGALALRRRRIHADALAATEARLDHRAYEDRTVIAISQSGRSTDLLEALSVLRPRRLIALTNQPRSPLGEMGELTIDVGAGSEVAVPASKSVSASVAILLWAASLLDPASLRGKASLLSTAQAVRGWLDSAGAHDVTHAASKIAECASVAFLGSDYGWPIAREAALKLKEAAYVHAEGFSAGEFRHGSIAMVDAGSAVIGIADEDALPAVSRPLQEIAASNALRYTLGMSIPGVDRLGPVVDVSFNTLGWLVTAQLIALHAARARGLDSDAPRGLRKALVSE